MTSTLSPADTGEINRGGETVRLSEYATHLSPTRGLRRPDATGEILRVVDPGDAQPIFPLKRVLVADDVPAEHVDLLRRSVPFVFPEGYTYRGRVGRHRPKPVWVRLGAVLRTAAKR